MLTVRARGPLLDRFGLVLVLVLTSIVTQSLIDVRSSAIGQLVTHGVAGLALVVATRASGARLRLRRIMDVFVAATLVANLALVLTGTDIATPAMPGPKPDGLWFLAAAITPPLIARRLIQHTVVTTGTLLGAVAAYLQIAVAYALLFQTIDGFSTTPFFGSYLSTTTYTYVSLATIATLGYGDIVPVTDLGRLAAMTEAVVGQVYLVTFVAMIVSRFAAAPAGSRRAFRRGRQPDASDPAGEGAGDSTG